MPACPAHQHFQVTSLPEPAYVLCRKLTTGNAEKNSARRDKITGCEISMARLELAKLGSGSMSM
jgi:hypothetical protein